MGLQAQMHPVTRAVLLLTGNPSVHNGPLRPLEARLWCPEAPEWGERSTKQTFEGNWDFLWV